MWHGIRASCSFIIIMGCCCTSGAMAADIATSGFNEDVVLVKGTEATVHRFDGINASWVEEGYNGFVQGPGAGLPTSGQFTSATGSGVVYHLQPYKSNNVLRIGDNDPLTGTLRVVPGRYVALHLLAASGAGPGYPPTKVDVTLNFSDGSFPLPGSLLTHDWDQTNTFAPGTPPPIAISIFARAVNEPGTWIVDSRNVPTFCMYESMIDLTQLGTEQRILQSITFTYTAPENRGPIGIFAADGTPVPEPTALCLFGSAVALVPRRRHAS